MITLALDSAGKTAGVAIVKDDELIYESYLSNGLTHSETLLALCDNALNSTGLSIKDIDLFAAVTGPGSFTGLRIGIAIIKGFALAANKPCVGVSTLHSLAYGCIINGRIIASLDARRGEVYYAVFEKHGNELTRLCEDDAAPAEQLNFWAKNVKKPVIFIGDGAKICYNALKQAMDEEICAENDFNEKLECILYPKDYRTGRAGSIAKIANEMYLSGKSISADDIMPSYHRLSQAERARQQNENN